MHYVQIVFTRSSKENKIDVDILANKWLQGILEYFC